MFGKGHAYRMEIDILIVDREIGVTIIEVKGISIRQIQNISGKVWSCEKDGTPFDIEPHSAGRAPDGHVVVRASMRIHALSEARRRAIVALPYITRHEWEGAVR